MVPVRYIQLTRENDDTYSDDNGATYERAEFAENDASAPTCKVCGQSVSDGFVNLDNGSDAIDDACTTIYDPEDPEHLC